MTVALSSFPTQPQPPLHKPSWRASLIAALIFLLALGGTIAIVGPYAVEQALRYPNSIPGNDCSPIIASPPVVTGLNRVSYRISECYFSSDPAEKIASWYEKKGWNQRVYMPIPQATDGQIQRLGPLTIVMWKQATALHLTKSPTRIKIEVGIRIILNR